MPVPRKFSTTDTFRGMRLAFEANRSLVIRITVVFAILNALTSLLDLTGAAGFAVSIGSLVLFGATYSGLVTALICLPGRHEGVGEPWQAVRPVLGALIWVALIYTATILVGIMALIAPGLIALTIWSIAGQVVLVERTGILAAFRRSGELIRGNGFPVFGFLLLVGIVALSISLLAVFVSRPLGDNVAGELVSVFLSNMFSAPFYALGSAALYNELVGRGVDPEPEQES